MPRLKRKPEEHTVFCYELGQLLAVCKETESDCLILDLRELVGKWKSEGAVGNLGEVLGKESKCKLIFTMSSPT